MDAFCYEQEDHYDPEYDLGEAGSFLNRMRIVTLGPIQLAPKHCNCSRCEWHGDEKPCVQKYVTMHQMNKHYNDCMVSKTLDLKAQTIATIGQMQSEFRAQMKEKDEQEVLLRSQHNAFMSSLPKESRAGKERRLQQKQKDFLEKLSNRPVRKVGFKKRIVKDTAVEVVTARRALRRKESRDNKKKEEIERAANFKATESVEQETSVVAQVEESVEQETSVVAQVEESVEQETSVVAQVEESVQQETSVVAQVEESVQQETSVVAQVEESVEQETSVVAQVEESVQQETSVVAQVEESKDVWQEVKKHSAKKSVALPNPTHKLACTRMCRSVETNEPCRHGNNCRFAHHISDLVFLYCSFGLGCRNVEHQSSGVYKNKPGKICNHMHPGETKESMCNRVGITDIRPKSISMSTKTNPSVYTAKPINTLQSNDKDKTKIVETKIMNEPCTSFHEDEIVIRVPKDLALQAMEITMKSGKTKIRIEIV
jgi:hypothetical protein